MRWLDFVARDPVPWLLDPINPSSRYLTLRDIFHKDDAAMVAEQDRILNWEPVTILRGHWDPVSHWGRANTPYFGGAVGSFGSLNMLQQIGAPVFPEAQATCEAILVSGRSELGVFVPERKAVTPWLCYTGIALQMLVHFGFGDDPRSLAARDIIVDSILNKPENLICPMIRGECRDGLVKALHALLHYPVNQHSPDIATAIDTLCDKLISHQYDFSGEDAEWAQPRYPRYYESDILELCHVLAHTEYRHDARFINILQPLLEMQDSEGKWHIARTSPSLSIERIKQPSRWLTYEAIHTLTSVYGDDIYGSR